MNGLEAIKHMENGKEIQNGKCVYKMVDGEICKYRINEKGFIIKESAVKPSPFPFNSVKFKFYEEPKALNGWERSEEYWTLNSGAKVRDLGDNIDETRYKYANYFSTEEKRNQVNDMGAIQRILQRFADTHNEEEIDWSNPSQKKWCILYNHVSGCFFYQGAYAYQDFGQVYFTSMTLAVQAVEELNLELETYFGRLSKCQKN